MHGFSLRLWHQCAKLACHPKQKHEAAAACTDPGTMFAGLTLTMSVLCASRSTQFRWPRLSMRCGVAAVRYLSSVCLCLHVCNAYVRGNALSRGCVDFTPPPACPFAHIQLQTDVSVGVQELVQGAQASNQFQGEKFPVALPYELALHACEQTGRVLHSLKHATENQRVQVSGGVSCSNQVRAIMKHVVGDSFDLNFADMPQECVATGSAMYPKAVRCASLPWCSPQSSVLSPGSAMLVQPFTLLGHANPSLHSPRCLTYRDGERVHAVTHVQPDHTIHVANCEHACRRQS